MSAPEHLTFLGHATVLLEVEGTRVITDPVLRRGASFLRRVPRAADLRGYTDADVVLISHMHHDHLDLPSLRLMSKDCLIVVPKGAGDWLRTKGLRTVVELEPGEIVKHGAVTVTATYADHSGRREPLGPTALAVGYLIEAGPALVYFAGDTDLFEGMGELAPRGELDVALLPVWGWGPNLGPGHLNPKRAALAAQLLRPRYAVPIHWGTLSPAGMHRLPLSRIYDPPHEFAAAVAELGLDVEVLVTAPGERVAFLP
ncbi:MAG TPA: MBL fold metallo-hydrolase [Actinomycetes bacterium]|nr:MBL fold metallo-hydrolase [Actinomycetes bacterium]